MSVSAVSSVANTEQKTGQENPLTEITNRIEALAKRVLAAQEKLQEMNRFKEASAQKLSDPNYLKEQKNRLKEEIEEKARQIHPLMNEVDWLEIDKGLIEKKYKEYRVYSQRFEDLIPSIREDLKALNEGCRDLQISFKNLDSRRCVIS